MIVIMDKANYQLRAIAQENDTVIATDTHIELPGRRIHDLNKDTAIISKFDGKIPCGWPKNSYYYSPAEKIFVLAVPPSGHEEEMRE